MHNHRVIASSQGLASAGSFPAQLVLSSQNRWEGLTLLVYSNEALPDWFAISSQANPVIAMVTRGSLAGETKAGRHIRHFAAPVRTSTIIPAHFCGDFLWHTAYECLQAQLATDLLARLIAEVVDADPACAAFPHLPVVADPLMTEILLAVKGELETGGLFGRIYVESLAQVLALHLLRQYAGLHKPVAELRGSLSPVIIQRAKELIRARLSEDLSLAEIAAQIGVSPYYLTRLFKRSTGLSLHRYIIAERVEVARRLLLARALPLKDIATQVGFADQSHFTRHFKRLLGVTPGVLAGQHHTQGGDAL